MNESAQKLTAFVDPRTGRQYCFARMPMGLVGSPASMARVTGHAFHDLLSVCMFRYVDGILCFTEPNHVKALHKTNGPRTLKLE